MRITARLLAVRTTALAAVVIALFAYTAPARGQSVGACLPDDAGGAESLAYLKKVVSSMEDELPVLRDSLGIAAYPDTSVALVQDQALCQQAVLAFERDVADSTQAGRRVYVFRVSNAFYVVEDPEERAGEWSIFALYTPSWVHHKNVFW